MSNSPKDKMLNEWAVLANHYHYLESLLIDTIQIIPLENVGTTHSPKLYDILQSTCSQFESLLKLLCRYLKLTPTNKKGIVEHYKQINQWGLLYWQMVTYRMYPYGEPTCPFRDGNLGLSFQNKSKHRIQDPGIMRLEPVPNAYKKDELPAWWKKYNETKHKLPSGYKEGNLQNTCTALAGLYSLHALFYCLQHKSNSVNLDPKHWFYTYPHPAGIHHEQIGESHIPAFKSNLFIYLIR